MENRPRRAVVAAGILLTTAVCATIPASAAPQRGADQVTAFRQTPATALVVNARWGGHCTYDRLVIDVRGTVPPVTVKRVKELRYDATGKKVPLAGKYFLEIKLSPAAAHNQSGQSVYQGPRLTKINLPKLKGLALTGDFEGVVSFGAAFSTKPVYNTFKLHSPERFVIDTKHANLCR
ncbi:AMIN-like domain-containing (lipo)protein [Streptomyces sp. SAS_270]|uniref:AMIN-like domain-containing (lipo)protein n=1 Tax=Streptomyces sp. SAS_270 TaxID=3412748 RepID=UPI00403C31B3